MSSFQNYILPLVGWWQTFISWFHKFILNSFCMSDAVQGLKATAIYIRQTHTLLPLSSSMDEPTIISSKTIVLISVMCDSMWYKIRLQGDEVFCHVSKSSYSRGQLLVGTVLGEVTQSPWFFKIRNMTASLIAFLTIFSHFYPNLILPNSSTCHI